MSEFFNMGGYAVYIWSAYVVMAGVLLINVWLPLRRQRRQKRRIFARQGRGS